MRAWQVTSYGRPTEALELLETADPVPEAGEVLVRTTASILNFNEVDACYGRYLTVNPPLPYTLGMECVGEVVDTGSAAESWIGRRVTASARGATGAHADLVACPTTMVFEAPEQLGDVEAAAFLYPFHLAYLGLHEQGSLSAGETVLIHAAAGGIRLSCRSVGHRRRCSGHRDGRRRRQGLVRKGVGGRRRGQLPNR